jgi:hypothetical protein
MIAQTGGPACPSNEPLQDGTAGRYLHGGYTPCVEHQQSIAVTASQDTGLVCEREDDVVDHLGFAARIPVLVRDVHAVTADEADTKDDRLHALHPRPVCRAPDRSARPLTCPLGGGMKRPAPLGDFDRIGNPIDVGYPNGGCMTYVNGVRLGV